MSRSNTPKKDSEVVTEPEAHDVTAKEGLFAQDDTCTCGKCIRGLLSPRLRFAFKTQAHVLYFMLTPTTNQYSEDGETWINLNECVTTFSEVFLVLIAISQSLSNICGPQNQDKVPRRRSDARGVRQDIPAHL